MNPPTSVQEFTIRVPKNVSKRYNVMRFNGTLDVDFSKWSQVKMERENNMKEYKGIEDEMPKYGAGSEFGREARRKKLGIPRKYNADNQPWILKSKKDSTVKKFKGIREGGVSENTAYYVFTHGDDGQIEAFPLDEWYKFQPIQRYKTLSAEEAEEEFMRRNKHLNYFQLMLRKRLKGEDDAELDEGEEKTKKSTKKDKELKISEMDEWMDSDDDSSEGEMERGEDDEDADKKKKKNKKIDPKKNKKKRDTDVEAFEESDDGDDEGRERDYISDSSESEPENTNLGSVAEEKALRKLLTSDESSDEDSEKEQRDEEGKEGEKKEEKPEVDRQKKVKKNKEEVDDDDPFSSDSSTDEDVKKKKDKKAKKDNATPTDNKRKLIADTLAGPTPKKAKIDLPNYIPGSIESGITEEAVRKYLMRKPMTTTELLQKFKSKKTGLTSEQLVNIMTQILKRINLVKQTFKGKMYLSIKS